MWRISVAIDEGAVKHGPLMVTSSIFWLRVEVQKSKHVRSCLVLQADVASCQGLPSSIDSLPITHAQSITMPFPPSCRKAVFVDRLRFAKRTECEIITRLPWLQSSNELDPLVRHHTRDSACARVATEIKSPQTAVASKSTA